jgi:EAL domain-containing protein (putative c-di-GMP-specific phosphodiesterase class I)
MSFKDLHILVVDDSALQRVHLVDLLHSLQAGQVSQAGDGREALRMLLQSGSLPDVVLCDLEMPGMDGVELLRAIGDAALPLAVAVISSQDRSVLNTVDRMSRVLGLTMLGALQKPVDISQLEELVSGWTPSRDQAPQSAAEAIAIQREDLHSALANREMICYFQPKINMHTGLLRGVEALVRWQHPQRGLVPPGQFLPLILRYDLMDAMTINVIEDTIAALTQWNDKGLRLTASVNLSAQSLTELQWADWLADVVKLAGLSPKQLVLEVTESEVIRDLAKALGTLARVRMKGFGLAIDDYGTGYSSMQQLSMIPFTELKLDRSLVHGIAHDAGLRVIVESALEMSRRLGLCTVAEGIESDADWRILAQLNCELVQGYVVARPMPAADLLPWWREAAPSLRERAQRLAAGASPPS